jgi:DNA polymerase I-like protein with 3'-5' exonuclease and polymerase domains
LDFITAFTIRNSEFWKNEGHTGNLEDYYRYNARDGWATANSFLSILSELPEYATRNYCQEFPVVFPCHQAEMTGIQVDMGRLEQLRSEQTQKLEAKKADLGVIVGAGFNPSSPPQVKRLMQVLGCDTSKGTGVIQLQKAMFQHPLNTRILDAVLEYRKARKLVSTYLVPNKFWKGRCFYAINPHGTDTARLASTESQFAGWGDYEGELSGLQIHNIPRDRDDIEVKAMFVADSGFLFGEGDYKQAEARDTGYLSGDKNLIAAVDSENDFHATNVERFFGLPYNTIYDNDTNTVLNKEIRYLSKRTNHGANYNMGWAVLIDTMGLKNIYLAHKLLKLPTHWGPRKIAEYLLDCYDKAYPDVRGPYYDSIKYAVLTTRMLVSPLGWTRYCFGNPNKSKQDLNSYVAHPSQNLNAGTLNRAWMSVFENVALREPRDFKLCAQIHDSIVFQYREGRTDLVRRVAECMLFSVEVKDCKGVTRQLRVPVDMKAEAKRWSDIKEFKL